MSYAGLNGFLGTRASLMLDVVFVAMFAVIPLLGWSVWLVKFQRRYALHKRIQLALGIVLLATVALFEADMRVNGWQDRARPSPYYSSGQPVSWVEGALAVHLFFAITTAVLWLAVTVQALRKFPRPPAPNTHSPQHRLWGKLAAIDMLCTAATGWIFYWLAFVAR